MNENMSEFPLCACLLIQCNLTFNDLYYNNSNNNNNVSSNYKSKIDSDVKFVERAIQMGRRLHVFFKITFLLLLFFALLIFWMFFSTLFITLILSSLYWIEYVLIYSTEDFKCEHEKNRWTILWSVRQIFCQPINIQMCLNFLIFIVSVWFIDTVKRNQCQWTMSNKIIIACSLSIRSV